MYRPEHKQPMMHVQKLALLLHQAMAQAGLARACQTDQQHWLYMLPAPAYKAVSCHVTDERKAA